MPQPWITSSLVRVCTGTEGEQLISSLADVPSWNASSLIPLSGLDMDDLASPLARFSSDGKMLAELLSMPLCVPPHMYHMGLWSAWSQGLGSEFMQTGQIFLQKQDVGRAAEHASVHSPRFSTSAHPACIC